MDLNLRAKLGAASRWHPDHPDIELWRSQMCLDTIRETIYRKLLKTHQRELGRELLFGDGEEGGTGS